MIQRLWSIAWALPFLLLAGRVLRFCATLVSSLGRPMRMADCLLVAREDPRWGQLVAATIPLPQRGPSGRRRAGRWAIDPGATRWRAQDFPLRHVLRMAAWNAPGWPYRLVRSSFRPALGRVLEEVAECDPEGGLSVRECMYRAALSAPGWTPSPPRRALRAMLGSVTEAEEESSWGISRRRAIDRQLMVDLVSGRGWSAASWPPSFCPACCVVSDPDAVFEMRGPHVAQTSGGLELSNRFSPLQCEEVESEGGPEDELSCQPSGRPPGESHSRQLRRGPRAPKEVRDAEAHLMRPVPQRRRTESRRVLEAHARFLQIVFRRTARLAALRCSRDSPSAPSAWSRGGMRGLLPIFRPVHRTRCAEGIASPEDFERQRLRSRRVLMWYRQYSELLRKLLGRQPEVLDLFCGQGGVSEGIRRAGLAPSGIDWQDQPMFRRRFGDERFRAADAYLPSVVEEALERFRAVGVGASPPCQPYSTVLADGSTATASPGIPQVAALLRGTGRPFWVENVLGADADELPELMTILRGPMFGLPVDRGRRFWTSFPLHLDRALIEGGAQLRQRCCLGPRRRWLRLDPMGRPVRQPCCRGNLYQKLPF